jgi:hypothetical protein
MDLKFWARPHEWPRDPSGYVFLARAVEKIGRARFGDKWTGEELTAQGVVRAQNAQLEPLRRCEVVKQEIVSRCESGQITSALRPVAGGSLMTIPRQWWNTENWRHRFIMCQLNPREPFGYGFAGDHYCWIFLTCESLDKFLLGQPFAPIAEKEKVHLSPYMKVMISVAKQLDISPDHQPKKSEIEHAINSTWTGPGKLSKNLVEAAATLLREPESQRGRASPTQKTRSKR